MLNGIDLEQGSEFFTIGSWILAFRILALKKHTYKKPTANKLDFLPRLLIVQKRFPKVLFHINISIFFKSDPFTLQ